MKLYSLDLSPYASRVRVSIYAKKLPIEIVAPPAAGIKSAEYLALNPMGKIPTAYRSLNPRPSSNTWKTPFPIRRCVRTDRRRRPGFA